MMLPAIPIATVDKQSAAGFASVWRYNGLAVPMDDVHIQYAVDFANTVLRSFIEIANQNLAAIAAAIPQEVAPALEPAAPSVVLTGE